MGSRHDPDAGRGLAFLFTTFLSGRHCCELQQILLHAPVNTSSIAVENMYERIVAWQSICGAARYLELLVLVSQLFLQLVQLFAQLHLLLAQLVLQVLVTLLSSCQLSSCS